MKSNLLNSRISEGDFSYYSYFSKGHFNKKIFDTHKELTSHNRVGGIIFPQIVVLLCNDARTNLFSVLKIAPVFAEFYNVGLYNLIGSPTDFKVTTNDLSLCQIYAFDENGIHIPIGESRKPNKATYYTSGGINNSTDQLMGPLFERTDINNLENIKK